MANPMGGHQPELMTPRHKMDEASKFGYQDLHEP